MISKHDREFTNEDREQLLEMLSLAEERLEQSAKEHMVEDYEKRPLHTFLDLDISSCVIEVIREAIIINKLPDFDIRYYEDETT